MKKKVTLFNICTSVLVQLVTIVYYIVIQKYIISEMGSDINGLVSSISQFLNYLSLLEGGVSAVITASLFKPLVEHDPFKVSAIVNAAKKFLSHIAYICVIYTFILATIYPKIINTKFTYGYVFWLVIIIGMGQFAQYFFAVSDRILLNADKKIYIVSFAQITLVVLNFVFSVAVIYIYPEIHLLKFVLLLATIVQIVIYRVYVTRHYKIDRNIPPDQTALRQRWDGFGQNMAWFINGNTDIVVLTLLSSLYNVSVYNVYITIINAVKNVANSISAALIPAVGQTFAVKNEVEKNEFFDLYEFSYQYITLILFVCCAILVTPFVSVYTRGVTDTDYIQELFGYLMVLAVAMDCYGAPYIQGTYVNGDFKQTSMYSYISAGVNIVISVLLVGKYGLIGVAIGTFAGGFLRMLFHMIYLKKHILNREFHKSIKSIAFAITCVGICFIINGLIGHYVRSENYFNWCILAVRVCVVTTVVVTAVSYIMYSKQLRTLLLYLKNGIQRT